jgi:hypothetical protein
VKKTESQWNWGILPFLSALVSLSHGSAFADAPPPMQPDPISLDTASPSGPFGFFYSTNNIYGEAAGGGSGGADVGGGAGPVLHVFCGSFGVGPLWAPGHGNNVDGISNNEVPAQSHVIYFSGDDQSIGIPGTHYDHQAVRQQAAGDRFVTNGFTSWNVPAIVFGGFGPAMINGPILPGPINLLSANQTRYNEIPTIPPAQFNAYVPPPGVTSMDDMDALEITPLDLNGDQGQDMPLYFTLDAASPDLTTLHGGATGATILVAPPYAPPFVTSSVYAPFPMLGLTPLDEIDALAVWDVAGDMQVAPGMDYAIFSLAPASPTLMQLGFSAADVLATGFTGVPPSLYLPAAQLGLLPSDNIDGLDVEPFVGPGSVEIWDELVEEFLAADFDEDRDVDGDDLARWRIGFGLSAGALHGQGDADGDADVDGGDFLIWQRQLVDLSPAQTMTARIPEPTTRAALAVAILLLAIPKRRRGNRHGGQCAASTRRQGGAPCGSGFWFQ